MRSTHPAWHRKLLMSSSRPTALGPCRHTLFEAFGYWSAVRSRRAEKKIRRMRGRSPPTTPPPFFLCLLTSLSPRKKQKHLFHSLSIASRFLEKKSTAEQESIFFALFTPSLPSNLHKFSLFNSSHRSLWCQDVI